MCGLQAGHYDIGVCGMRWAYALAIVLVCDAFILAALAFVLAAKQANLLPEAYKKKPEKEIEKEKGNICLFFFFNAVFSLYYSFSFVYEFVYISTLLLKSVQCPQKSSTYLDS